MAEVLVAIIAAYGLGIGLVHLFQRKCHWGRRQSNHALIVLRDVELTVEWHLRSFALMEWLHARHTKVTVLDEGSTDDTLRIAEKWIAGTHGNWEIVSVSSVTELQEWLDRADRVIFLRGQGADDPLSAAPL